MTNVSATPAVTPAEAPTRDAAVSPPAAPITSNVPLLLSYAAIPSLWLAAPRIEMPYTVQILGYVLAILYVGCHSSLQLLNEDGAHALTTGEESEDMPKQPSIETETMSTSDAMQFPLVGSCGLFGMYSAFKFFDEKTVNLIIGVYFTLMGWAAITATIEPSVRRILPENLNKKIEWDWKLKHPLPQFIGGESPWDLSATIFTSDFLAALVSAILAFRYFFTRHWTLNNIIGICFCIQSISKFSLGTFKISAILLVGLFFYDIFWVFGTDVMVTVAKKIDGPIKLLFPRSLVKDADGKLAMSLLGLGDIVIPGFFISLLLRFDASQEEVRRHGPRGAVGKGEINLLPPVDPNAAFPKPYFHACLVGYMLGLGMTLFIMIYFDAAQPALLYLVPACLGSALLTALVRGEMKELFEYSEEVDEEEELDGVGGEKSDEAKKME